MKATDFWQAVPNKQPNVSCKAQQCNRGYSDLVKNIMSLNHFEKIVVTLHLNYNTKKIPSVLPG
jgi:hypothetical protein